MTTVDLKLRLWNLPASCSDSTLREALQLAGFAATPRLHCWKSGAQIVVPLAEDAPPSRGRTPALRKKTGSAMAESSVRALGSITAETPASYNFELVPRSTPGV